MKNVSIHVLALFIALCSLALPAVANSSLAELADDPSGISFNLSGDNYEAVTITINGPGDLSLRETFATGNAPVFSLFDEAGNALPDGVFSYELRAQPRIDAGLRAEIEAARAAGDNTAIDRLRAAGRLPAATSLVQSGYFSIVGGSVVVPDSHLVEANQLDTDDSNLPPQASIDIPTKDQVILDDLIVTGNLCIGLECVDGEQFGSDTIRIKDNNVRIKFDDTSTSAPNTDWQLTVNDSANGGAERFSIDDTTNGRTPFTIEAGAPDHAAYVEDGGNLGLGTSTPLADMHVVEGNTPTLRFEQDGSDGLTPQTWDVAGNDASFFIRDATNGSTQVFRIQPGAPADSIFVEASGEVGIGTATPGQKLDVIGGNIQARRDDGGQTSFFITSTGGTTDISYILRANPNLAGVGGFAITSAGVSPFRIFNGAASRTLDITPTGINVVGTLSVNGVGMTVPDYVFEPDFPLETIEEHASFMWQNKHLPALKPAQFDDEGRARIDIGGDQMGMLEELEKAHVYIDQLNTTLKDKNEELAALTALTEKLAVRLARLEAQQNVNLTEASKGD